MLRQASASPPSTSPSQHIHGSAELELLREVVPLGMGCVKPDLEERRQKGSTRIVDVRIRTLANRTTGLRGLSA